MALKEAYAGKTVPMKALQQDNGAWRAGQGAWVRKRERVDPGDRGVNRGVRAPTRKETTSRTSTKVTRQDHQGREQQPHGNLSYSTVLTLQD